MYIYIYIYTRTCLTGFGLVKLPGAGVSGGEAPSHPQGTDRRTAQEGRMRGLGGEAAARNNHDTVDGKRKSPPNRAL